MRLQYIFLIIGILVINVNVFSQKNSDIFPLEKGNYWLYEGTFKIETDDGGITDKKVKLRMEVLENITRGNIFAALLKGHPYDLLNYEGDSINGNYVIIYITGKYFFVPEDRSETVYNRLKNPEDSLYNLLEGAQLFLETPLEKGKVFGDVEQISRLDGMYCWKVDSVANGDKGKKYMLSYSSLPDKQKIEFTTGLGITDFKYKHNGFLMEADLKLVEFNKSQLHGKNIN